MPDQHAPIVPRWALAALVLTVGGVIGWSLLGGDADTAPIARPVGAVEGTFRADGGRPRLIDTRDGGTTVDGRHAGDGPLAGSGTRRFDVAGRAGAGAASVVALDIRAETSSGGDVSGSVSLSACGDDTPQISPIVFDRSSAAAGTVATRLGAEGQLCVDARIDAETDIELTVDLVALLDGPSFRPDNASAVLDNATLSADRPVSIVVAEPDSGATFDGDAVWITASAQSDVDGRLSLRGCDASSEMATTLAYRAGGITAGSVLVPTGVAGALCVEASSGVVASIDVVGVVDASVMTMADTPARMVDTRSDGSTVDGLVEGQGLRPAESTLRVPVRGRGDIPDDATSLVVATTLTDVRGAGSMVVHTPGGPTPTSTGTPLTAGTTATSMSIVAIGQAGDICVHTGAATHLTLDIVGWSTDPTSAPVTPASGVGETECPAQSLFPHWRMVAIYGTERTERLGLLGEQTAEESFPRLAEIVDEWSAIDDRPILPAYDLIATLATATRGDNGFYNLPSSDEFIQRYLDAARADGVYLILDIQPGQSDFLTEAVRYEKFLREPDVGLALDPEWRTSAPQTPGGGYVGKVGAAEVNAVSRWLSGIVAEEQIPEKLLVVHQFQDRMINGRDLLEAPPGVALTIHMDGQGGRSVKLDTYSRTTVSDPLNNGFKLFFDEDIEMFQPSDVLGPTISPTPDLVTYQ